MVVQRLVNHPEIEIRVVRDVGGSGMLLDESRQVGRVDEKPACLTALDGQQSRYPAETLLWYTASPPARPEFPDMEQASTLL